MALFTDWSEKNMVVSRKPVVKYDPVPFYYTYPDGTKEPLYWTITRSSSQYFEYIGMTESAAIACANELRAKWTLRYLAWEADVVDTDPANPEVNINPFTIVKCSSDIQAEHVDGDNWKVSCQIDEVDVVVSTKELATDAEFEAYFQEATDRKIITGKFKLVDAHWSTAFGGMVVADFIQDISDFDPSAVVVKIKVGTAWSSVPSDRILARTNQQITFGSERNCTFKLVYGSLETDEFTTKDVEPPSITLDALDIQLDDTTDDQPVNVAAKADVTISGGVSMVSSNWSIRSTVGYIWNVIGAETLGDGRYRLDCGTINYRGGNKGIFSVSEMFRDGAFYANYTGRDSFGVSNQIPFSRWSDEHMLLAGVRVTPHDRYVDSNGRNMCHCLVEAFVKCQVPMAFASNPWAFDHWKLGNAAPESVASLGWRSEEGEDYNQVLEFDGVPIPDRSYNKVALFYRMEEGGTVKCTNVGPLATVTYPDVVTNWWR